MKLESLEEEGGRISLGELPFAENPWWVPQLRFGWMIGWLSFLVWKINPTSKTSPSCGWWVFFGIRSPLVFHLSLKHLEHHLGETLAIYKSELSQLLGDIRCLTLRSFFSICPRNRQNKGTVLSSDQESLILCATFDILACLHKR